MIRLLLILICLQAGSIAVATDPVIDSNRVANFLTIESSMNNEEFPQAESLSLSFIQDQPSDPLGYLVRASILMAEMTDREENLYPQEFFALLDTVEILSTNYLTSDEANRRAWGHLLIGHARANRCLWEGRFGSFLSAFKLGRRAGDEYEKGLAEDSTLYDLYSGIGSYRYWKSSKVGILRSMGLFKDERLEGIRELHIAADSSLISRESSMKGLIWIWLDFKMYDSSLAMASQMHVRYPKATSFLWAMARANYLKGDFVSALQNFQNLRDRADANRGNCYNLIESEASVTRCFIKLKKFEEAQQDAVRFLGSGLIIPPRTQDRQQSNLDFLQRTSNGKF
jgi:tetratricopeptide (TPR) repeat protein